MAVATFEAVFENGQLRLPPEAALKEQQVVFVIVPNAPEPLPHRVPGVRLANPVDAQRFELTVKWDDES